VLSGSQLLFGDAGSGAVALRYGDLRVVDAAGRVLPSHIELSGHTVGVVVDVVGARFPVRVDPFIQQGESLTGAGEIGKGSFGGSVAISGDGNTVLIGGANDDGDAGAAWVFTRTGETWSQDGPKLTGPGAPEEHFGSEVALSSDGNVALVTGWGPPEKGEEAVWVFTRTGDTWTQAAKLIDSENEPWGRDEKNYAVFGGALALSADGSTVIVGGQCASVKGAVWAFVRSGSTWVQQGPTITEPEEAGHGGSGCGVSGEFGAAVALSADGNTALIGAPTNETAGAAWVFTRTGEAWTQQGKALSVNYARAKARYPGFGETLALSADGNTALIGQWAAGEGQGAVWVFRRTGESWSQQPEELAPRPAGVGWFGDWVALSGDAGTALIGSGSEEGPVVWRYTQSGSTWVRHEAPINKAQDGAEVEGRFVLSADGGTALFGGPSLDEGAGAASVLANVYLPVSETGGVVSVTSSAATLDGSVDPEGLEVSACEFQYGLTVGYGSSVPCSALPGAGATAVGVSALLSGLAPGTTYHYRVLASNPAGTSYGTDATFTTLQEPVSPPTGNTLTSPMPTATVEPAALGGLGGVLSPFRVSLASTRLAATRRGTVPVTVLCTAPTTSCSGTITLQSSIPLHPKRSQAARRHDNVTLTIAAGRFTTGNAHPATIQLRLSPTALRLLTLNGSLRATAAITARDTTGTPSTAQTTVLIHHGSDGVLSEHQNRRHVIPENRTREPNPAFGGVSSKP
jgi:hypothetical protein